MKPTEVTFDTNLWIRIMNEEMRKEHSDAVHISRLRNGVEAGIIKPFLCDATIFESVDRKFRKDFLTEYADPELEMDSFEETGDNLDGLPLINSFWKMQNRPDRPVNDLWKKDLEDALALGFRFIRSLVPKFGSMLAEVNLQEPVYKPLTDQEFRLLQSRFAVAQEELDKHGVGMGYVRQLVAAALEIPEAKVNLVELSVESKNKVIGGVAEWVDGLVICSHYAYQHEYLCTLDRAGGLGTKSAMHATHRPWLTAFGIDIVGAEELANKLHC